MSKSSKLKVEIDASEHGWTHVKLSFEDNSYEFFPSHVPIDSSSELVKAIIEILSGYNQSKVYWNDEPVEHNLFLLLKKDFVISKFMKFSNRLSEGI